MIEFLHAADLYLASCNAALHANQYEVVCAAKYRPGDPFWDPNDPECEDIEGGEYLDSCKAGKDPKGRGADE